MLNDFRAIMKEYYGVNGVELESDFKKDFDLNSFDFVNLICIIEEKYGVEIEESKYRELNTVKELIEYLQNSKQEMK
ncbi:MAG: hypothetical protein IKL06_04540 [Lachnospiraceae bacterium]|nr:hypothetical protein [Lachnospiraceae bacterium]